MLASVPFQISMALLLPEPSTYSEIIRSGGAAADAATGASTTGTATTRAPMATLPTVRRNDDNAMGPPGFQRGAPAAVATPRPHEMRREPNTVAAPPRLVGTTTSANGG